ncbi:MFS transport protein AraJ [Candidatus Izimaplasma bacterium HR1]|uniref:MFS transporter n=1 Tax=Candidatus Izimoplasma sp. HR1 TaxID=1541959 RepID=UPI0004F5865A|nr:MFS transport protein AraJ [Candidatus Izimaplasma bacterium HR1]
MKKYAIVILTLLTFVTVVEFSIVMPLGPQIADKYSISRNHISWLFVGYTFMGVFTPIIGYLADKYGLKRFIISSVVFFIIGAFMNSVVTSAVGYFIGRSIIGLGYYAITTLVIVYSSKIISYNHLGIVSGIYKFAFAGAMFAAPIIGTFYVQYFDISALYLSLAIATFILLLLLIPIKEIKGENDISLGDLKNMMKDRNVILMMTATFMLSVPSVFFFNYLSTHLQDIGYSVERASMMFTIVASGSIFAAILILLISDKVGKLRMAKVGIVIATFAMLGFLFNIDIVIIIAGILFGIGYDIIWGLFFPVSSKMYDVGVNSYIAVLSMSMAAAGVFTNLVAPIVMEKWNFSGNVVISFVALILTFITFYYGTIKFKSRLN